MPRESSSLRERSRKYDSSDSSDSEYSQKSSKKRYRSDRSKRSRSREKSSHRRRRSRSRSKKKSKRNDSRSPIRYYSSKRRSSSRERTSRRRSRSSSKERSYERSKSRSRERYDRSHKASKSKKSSSSYKSSKKRSSSRSVSPYSSREASNEVSKKYIITDTETEIEKSIKAAEAVGLTMCKLPSYEYKEVEVKEDMPTIQDRNVLDELNSESFAPKTFTSSRSKKNSDNIVIDLDAGTVQVPEVPISKVESLFHPELFPDEKTRMEKWVKKLFQFRQRALKGEI